MTYARDWARWASASGRYPVEAMRMMSRIVSHTEDDPHYRTSVDASRSNPSANAADAIGFAIRHVTELLQAAATVAYSSSGYSALRMARERPRAPIIGMTPRLAVARRLALVWGVHAVLCHDVADVAEITDLACETARRRACSIQTLCLCSGGGSTRSWGFRLPRRVRSWQPKTEFEPGCPGSSAMLVRRAAPQPPWSDPRRVTGPLQLLNSSAAMPSLRSLSCSVCRAIPRAAAVAAWSPLCRRSSSMITVRS